MDSGQSHRPVDPQAGPGSESGVHAPRVALVIEGGGMRNSYTAACIHELVRHGVSFGWVGGVSAGASHLVNFLSHDAERAKRAFVEFGSHPKTGGLRSFLRGNGFFNAEYIYEIAGNPDSDLPLDYDAFRANPTPYRIAAFRADTGETVYWGREDIDDLASLMRKVRASSTLPGLMPTPFVDGVPYVDGAIGTSGGIVTEAAEADGFDRFLVLCTRGRDYERTSQPSEQLVRRWFRNFPAVAEAIITRHERYNASRAYLRELERDGRAMVFYPDAMRVENRERNLAKLQRSYADGLAQTQREWPSWMEFLRS